MLTRRTLLRSAAGLASLAVVSTLPACGADEAAPSSAPDDSASPDTGAFPRDVEHELGSTRVPSAPKRVVCGTDGAELCSLLALGVVPVGYGQRNEPPRPWLADLVTGIDSYDLSSGETSYEALAAWAPDLLLVQNGFATDETLPRFSDIAPTVATSFIDWRANLRQVGAAVGLDDAAATLEKEKEAAVKAVADDLAGDLGGRAEGLRVRALTAFSDGSVYALNAASPVGKASEALGLASQPKARARAEAVNQLSLEQIDAVDGDVLLLLTFDEKDNGNAKLSDNRLFQRLDVVRRGKVLEVPPDEAHQLYFDSVLTVAPNASLLADYVRRALA